MTRQRMEITAMNFRLDWAKFKFWPFLAFMEFLTKSYSASDREHGPIKLHNEFQLNILKNGRDIAQIPKRLTARNRKSDVIRPFLPFWT